MNDLRQISPFDRGADTDIVTASVEAFIDCINKFRG